MAAQHLPPDYECGFCASRTESMRDPRELPCQHVLCLSCIEGYYNQHGSVTCPTCGEVHETLNFEELPKVETEDAKSDLDTLYCTAYGCQGQIAMCFCITCGDKFCTDHQKLHTALYKESHMEIDIEVYKQSPATYTKPVCEQHAEILDRACKKCDRLICVECDVHGTDCTEENQHNFKSFSSLQDEINTYLQTQLHITTEKINKVYDLDKKIWRELDGQEQTCRDLVKQIRKLRKEGQIKKIKEKSQGLMKKVRGYKKEVTNEVEACYNNLMLKRNELQKVQNKLNNLIQNSHVAEKVKQRKGVTEELTKIELDKPAISKPQALCQTNGRAASLLGMSLVTVPSSLTFISEHRTIGQCMSACYRQNGDLLVGTSGGLYVLRRGGDKVSVCSRSVKSVTSVVEHHQNVFILHRKDDISKVEMYYSGKELFQFYRTSDVTAVMAVSDRYVVVTHPDTGQIIIYDFISQKIARDYRSLDGLQFLPDGCMLGVCEGKLQKYTIENRQLVELWTCDDIRDGYSLCTDSNGLIYISTRFLKKIYIVSSRGELLQTLSHDNLPPICLPTNFLVLQAVWPGSLPPAGVPSIRDGVIAVPGWSDRMLCLFRIT